MALPKRPLPKDVGASLRQWMQDELSDRQGAAEERFRVLATGLPRVVAPQGFEMRVLAVVGAAQTSASARSSISTRLARVAVVILSVTLAVYGAVALAPWVATQFVSLLNVATRGFVWAVQAADSGLDVWTIVARAGRTIGSAIAAPSVTLTFVGVELVGVAALYALHRLLKFDKETSRW